MRTGKSGENTATVFVKRAGYRIIERNFRCIKGEIDLIAKKNNTLIFIEVKTRNSLKYGLPSESVTTSKIDHIKAVANWYITANPPNDPNMDIRFDVLEILRLNNRQYVRHIENAF